MKTLRAYSLDALRGYAILTMVLSGQIASGVLPAWMYHAQVGPRSGGAFDPSFVGITWVDLVFPFFLFAMGAAFPFSLGSKLERGVNKLKLAGQSFLRYLRLAFFAIFIQHAYPHSLSQPQDVRSWCLALVAFALLLPMFMRIKAEWPRWVKAAIELGGYAAGVTFLLTVDYAGDRTFSLGYSNIIILVLANMAFFGSVIYILTWRNARARWTLLPFVMAILLGCSTEGSWQAWLMNATPAPWLYRFLFLKYLFIVLPGTLAGEWLRGLLQRRATQPSPATASSPIHDYCAALLGLAVIVCNLYGLYTRQLVANLVATAVLLVALWAVVRKVEGDDGEYWRKLLAAGAYLLMLGLFFEAFEGGIRKDSSTFSYYFVTSGLAFIALITLSVVCDLHRAGGWTRILELPGQNPMVAYVAPQLFVLPIIKLVGLGDWLNSLSSTPFEGLMRGVIVTALAMAVASFFSLRRWYWRT